MKTTGILIACSFVVAGVSSLAEEVRSPEIGAIDWPAFLARHDLRWSKAPKSHGESAFLGNGMLGATIWSARGEALHWDLGRCDLYDTAGTSKNRMPLGKLILKLKGTPESFSMRQSLYRAEATGKIGTDAGAIEWRSIVPHDRMVGLIDYKPSGGEAAEFGFFQLPPVNFNALRKALGEFVQDKPIERRAKRIRDFSDPAYQPLFKEMAKSPKYKRLFQCPENVEGQREGVKFLVQAFPRGGGYVVAWADEAGKGGRHLMAWTVDFFRTGAPGPDRAVAAVKNALGEGYDAIAKRNAEWWAKFHRRSFVSIPDQVVERYYWLQIYKMGAATREGGVVLDQIGPWPRATGWARVWCNINIEIAYHSMMTCNHLELYAPFLRLFDENREKFARAVPEKFRSPGAMAVGRTMDIYGNTGWHWEFGDLVWVAHNYWMYCRYTGDEARMRTKFYPLLKGAATFMMNALEKDGNGVYHIPPDISPEYSSERYRDNNYNLALLRWALRTLQFMNRHYAMNDPDKARWDDVQAHLVPFPVDKGGLMIAAGVPFAESHRHYSNMLAFYPLRVLDPDSPKGFELCKRSCDHWVGLAGPGPKRSRWNSFSHFGAAGMAAWLRDGKAALTHLREGAASATPSTFFAGPGPAVESVLAGTIGLGEMLLQSATSDPGGFRLRIFPAIPAGWKEVRFEHLRAEGAFDVSAVMHGGKLTRVEITSLAGNPCRVEAPFADGVEAMGKRKFPVVEKTDRNGRKFLEIDLKKGERVALVGGGVSPVD